MRLNLSCGGAQADTTTFKAEKRMKIYFLFNQVNKTNTDSAQLSQTLCEWKVCLPGKVTPPPRPSKMRAPIKAL